MSYNKTNFNDIKSKNIETSTFDSVKSLLFDASFVLFPLIGYIAQYLKIRKLKNAFGFSKIISLILIVAFIFRIFFWVGKQFSVNLLLQAVAGLIMQMLLLSECVKYTKFADKDNSDYFRLKEFWNWPYYEDYLFIVINLICVLCFISHYIGYNNLIYVEALGTISAVTEAMLGMPQVYENLRNKNTDALSYVMIGTWVLGDMYKTVYFLSTDAPIQLILCAIFQLIIDFVVTVQILYYSRKKTIVSPSKELRIN